MRTLTVLWCMYELNVCALARRFVGFTQKTSKQSIMTGFWALICNNSWNSIQSDSLTSTSLSRTANDQAHRHFEAAELEKIAFRFTSW